MVIPNAAHRVFVQYREQLKKSRRFTDKHKKFGAGRDLMYIRPGFRQTYRFGNLHLWPAEYQTAAMGDRTTTTNNNADAVRVNSYPMVHHQVPDYQMHLVEEVNSLKSQLNIMETIMKQSKENMVTINLNCPFPGCHSLKVPLWCRQRLLDHLRDAHHYSYEDCRHSLNIMQHLDQMSLAWCDEVHEVMSRIHNLKIKDYHSSSSSKYVQNEDQRPQQQELFNSQNQSGVTKESEIVADGRSFRHDPAAVTGSQQYQNSEANFHDQDSHLSSRNDRSVYSHTGSDPQSYSPPRNSAPVNKANLVKDQREGPQFHQPSPKFYNNCLQTPHTYVMDNYQPNRSNFMLNSQHLNREKCYRDFSVSPFESPQLHHRGNHDILSQYRSPTITPNTPNGPHAMFTSKFGDPHAYHQTSHHHHQNLSNVSNNSNSNNNNNNNCSPSPQSSPSHSSSGHSTNEQPPTVAKQQNIAVAVAAEPKKPPQTYASLIRCAIQSSPHGSLNLAEIYDWISDRHPFFDKNKMNWKNAVRHNLSLYGYFVRVKTPWMKGSSRWTIDNDLLKENMNRKRPSNDFNGANNNNNGGCIEVFATATNNSNNGQQTQQDYFNGSDDANAKSDEFACKRTKIVLPNSEHEYKSENKPSQAAKQDAATSPMIKQSQQACLEKENNGGDGNNNKDDREMNKIGMEIDQNGHNRPNEQACDDDTTVLTDDGLIVDDSVSGTFMT